MRRRGIATGFDCEPLPDGNVLIEFFGNDGKTFNSQVVTRDLLQSMPMIATLTEVVIERGPEAAKQWMAQQSADPREE